jgi:hypothetical protein
MYDKLNTANGGPQKRIGGVLPLLELNFFVFSFD